MQRASGAWYTGLDESVSFLLAAFLVELFFMLIILIPVFPDMRLDKLHCQNGLETWLYVLLVFYIISTALSLLKYLLAQFWNNKALGIFVFILMVSMSVLVVITQTVITMNMSFGLHKGPFCKEHTFQAKAAYVVAVIIAVIQWIIIIVGFVGAFSCCFCCQSMAV